ncbi:MAG: DMT family transporter [Pseudomonadota bacterium]
MTTTSAQTPTQIVPYLVMLLTALCFSTNIVFGRFVAPDTHPFVLAFARWASVTLILAPLILFGAVGRTAALLRENWKLLVVLGFLGMLISGGGVYWGLQMTTATNATLIYSVAPVIILLLERAFRGRPIALRETIGSLVAFVGIATIVLQGTLSTLFALNFNLGDLLIAAATLSWAGYSILLRSPSLNGANALNLFCVIAGFGALANLPFAIWPLSAGEGLPPTPAAWQALGGIIVISSLMAFTGYQYGVRHLGSSIAGLFMFLMTPFGVILAVIFLGERLEAYQLIAIAAVLAGVGMATFPVSLLRR